MSVILITPGRYETLRKTMRFLRVQTVRDRLEIVIVASSTDALGFDESELQGFFQFQVVEIGAIQSLAQALAAGVRRATAPVVIYAEDHCYPEPTWAQALVEAHRGPWAAVGPTMGNANPVNMTSWANFFTAYGRWAEPAVAGEIDDLPAHNSAYKRAVLLKYGPALEAMLEVESLLHKDLLARGYCLYWEPAAKTHHVNYTRLAPMMRTEFNYGRLFGATRPQRRPVLGRLLYVLGGPLIPFVRLQRVLREVRRAGYQQRLLPRALPALLMGLVAATWGEIVGYIFGAGAAAQGKWEFEFDRPRYLRAQDRQGETG